MACSRSITSCCRVEVGVIKGETMAVGTIARLQPGAKEKKAVQLLISFLHKKDIYEMERLNGTGFFSMEPLIVLLVTARWRMSLAAKFGAIAWVFLHVAMEMTTLVPW